MSCKCPLGRPNCRLCSLPPPLSQTLTLPFHSPSDGDVDQGKSEFSPYTFIEEKKGLYVCRIMSFKPLLSAVGRLIVKQP